MASRDMSPRQLAILRTHFGYDCFTTRQARNLGIAPQQLHQAGAGTLQNVVRGVYRIDSGPLDLPGRARAVSLVLPREAAVARSTAAWILGVDTRSPNEREQPMDVECVVSRGTTPLRRGGIRCHETDLDPSDLVETGGLTCTTPTRTAADLLRWLNPPMGMAAADALAARGLITAEGVADMLNRWPGERFVKRARTMAAWIERDRGRAR